MIWFVAACLIMVAIIAQYYRVELLRARDINAVIAEDLLLQYKTIDEIIDILTEDQE